MVMMRSKIEKLSARIEALVTASEGGVAYIWRDRGQTVMEACESHYQRRPDVSPLIKTDPAVLKIMDPASAQGGVRRGISWVSDASFDTRAKRAGW